MGHQGRRACRAETVFRAGLARFEGMRTKCVWSIFGWVWVHIWLGLYLGAPPLGGPGEEEYFNLCPGNN